MIGGIAPFTTIDFPGRLAAVLFCQGCAWRCGYCHNPGLLPFLPGRLDWERIRAFLLARRGLLEAVVFSGGEPLSQPALPAAMREVRELGFAVGLHTTGASPARFGQALAQVDWVGFDVKAPVDRYGEITGRGDGAIVYRSLATLVSSRVAHEVRTTVDPRQLGETDLLEMARQLADAGVTHWVLQRCRGAGARRIDPLDDASLLARLRAQLPSLAVR
ncbi:MAG: 7-carboxy-7-deazaguanine synthase [Gammaproteobacteria bacterium]|nr:7-carboxy-7-deazaguanine synthase [Gammaproteobacteria bacterium]